VEFTRGPCHFRRRQFVSAQLAATVRPPRQPPAAPVATPPAAPAGAADRHRPSPCPPPAAPVTVLRQLLPAPLAEAGQPRRRRLSCRQLLWQQLLPVLLAATGRPRRRGSRRQVRLRIPRQLVPAHANAAPGWPRRRVGRRRLRWQVQQQVRLVPLATQIVGEECGQPGLQSGAGNDDAVSARCAHRPPPTKRPDCFIIERHRPRDWGGGNLFA
jgi:hypothetical protein